jgi:Tfp pilus assembly PilM family ATPase
MKHFSWIHKNYSPIGLDIGSTGIRAIQLTGRGYSAHVHSALEMRFDAGHLCGDGAIDDSGMDETWLIEQLRSLTACGGFNGNDVVLHCPTNKLDMRPVKLPSGPEGLPYEAIQGVIKLQTGQHLGIDPKQAVCEHFITDGEIRHGQLTVMAITADGQWIRRRLELVQAAGLRCLAVDALPCALARCTDLTDDKEADDACADEETPEESSQKKTDALSAILDIGYAGSTLVVRNNKGPVFCRFFSLGGRQLTDILSQRLLVGLNHAEALKLKYGLDCRSGQFSTSQGQHETMSSGAVATISPVKQNSEISQTIYMALQKDLAGYVEGLIRSLNYVITEHPGIQLQKMLLCGSGSHMRNLADFLTEQFGIPVEMPVHPLLAEVVGYLPDSRAQTGNWTTALGLALIGGAR